MREFDEEFIERETPEGFVVDDDKKAEYCLKKIKAAQAERDRLIALVNAEWDELDQKAKQIEQKYESETGYLKALLYRYFETVEKKESKTQQSYKLLSGSLVFKKPMLTIQRPDDETLLKILHENAPELIETVEKPKWSEYKKQLCIVNNGTQIIDATGAYVDDIYLEETPGSFGIKINKAGDKDGE